ncbi:MAG: hypothetical protein DMF93_21270 [Acidobacteria bacterium]|nr:MAG: hypothetical protein DMF93_21270 [Acidobacteriota bacterium]
MRADAARRRVTVVTSGHLSTCPRMLKAADALAEAGYAVHVVATRHELWAAAADLDVRSRRGWPLTIVNYCRGERGSCYWRTGVEHRASRVLVRAAAVGRVPPAIATRAFARVHGALVRAILETPADLIYGGTTGALAAIAEAGRRSRTPYAVDLEDLHSAETSGPDAPLVDALAERIERTVLAGAAFATTSSEQIAAAYEAKYGVAPAVIHNTFPLPRRAPEFMREAASPLRVYWFSQTIGPGRGLEQAISALGRADIAAELTLLGRPHDGFLDLLRGAARAQAPRVVVVHRSPAPPDAMVDCARGHDVGLALDHGVPLNRELCITNKALTYILAGVPVLMADTPGQRALGRDLGRGAMLVDPRDIDALAGAFRAWAGDAAALECAKRTAWQAAVRRWNWEHASERGVLYRLVGEALA